MRRGASLGGPSLVDLAGDDARVDGAYAGAAACRTFEQFQQWAIATTSLRARLSAEQRANLMVRVEPIRRALLEAKILAEIEAAPAEGALLPIVRRWMAEVMEWPEADRARVWAAAVRQRDHLIGIDFEDAA